MNRFDSLIIDIVPSLSLFLSPSRSTPPDVLCLTHCTYVRFMPSSRIFVLLISSLSASSVVFCCHLRVAEEEISVDCSHNSSSVCFLYMCYRSILVAHNHIEHLLVATGEVGLHTGTVFILCFCVFVHKEKIRVSINHHE